MQNQLFFSFFISFVVKTQLKINKYYLCIRRNMDARIGIPLDIEKETCLINPSIPKYINK